MQTIHCISELKLNSIFLYELDLKLFILNVFHSSKQFYMELKAYFVYQQIIEYFVMNNGTLK